MAGKLGESPDLQEGGEEKENRRGRGEKEGEEEEVKEGRRKGMRRRVGGRGGEGRGGGVGKGGRREREHRGLLFHCRKENCPNTQMALDSQASANMELQFAKSRVAKRQGF